MQREPTAAALRASRREPEAFEAFYAAHVESLLAFITRRVYEPEIGWDLCAESFARAYLKRRSFRGTTDGEAAAWLFAIARREISGFQRREQIEYRALRRLGIDAPAISEDEQTRILELAEVEDLRVVVREELARLSAAQRDALSLRIVEELPYEEVAARLGITEQSARARVFRGLKKLGAAVDLKAKPPTEGATT